MMPVSAIRYGEAALSLQGFSSVAALFSIMFRGGGWPALPCNLPGCRVVRA
jgi:hypothetical protein